MRKTRSNKKKPAHWPSLISALSNTKSHIGHLLAFSFAINLLVLAVPIFMIQIFDRVLVSHSFETLSVLAIGAVAALVVMSALDLVRGRILSRAALKLEDSLGQDLLAKQRQARLGDVAKLRQFISGPMMITVLDAPWVPLFLLVIYMLHPTLGLIALAGVILLAFAALAAEQWTRGPLIAARAAEKKTVELSQNLANDDGSAAVHGLEVQLAKHWQKAQKATARQRLLLADRTHTASVIGRFTRLVLQIVLMAAAAGLVITGQVTPGAMVAASVIAARAFGPVERAQELTRAVSDVRAALSRLLMTKVPVPPKVSGFPASSSPKLEVRNLAFYLEGGREPLFSNINFNAAGGEMIGITGASGSGKSMLSRLLVGLDTPAQGRVALDHQDISRITMERARTDIAYLSQSPKLHAGTIADNISRFGDPQSPEIFSAARFAGVEEDILELPDGYMTLVGQDAPPLSQGLVQRVLMARTFFDDPRLIILDEPYTFLDNHGIERLLSTLTHFRSVGSIVIVVSQRPSVLAQCDRVLVLENNSGRVVTRNPEAKLRLLANNDAVEMRQASDPAASPVNTAAE